MCFELAFHDFSPCMLVYLLQQQAPLPAKTLAQAHIAATEMTSAVLLLEAALPDRSPLEIVLYILSLAFFLECCCLSRLARI